MNKKSLAVLMTMAVAFSAFGCGSRNSQEPEQTQQEEAVTAATEAVATTEEAAPTEQETTSEAGEESSVVDAATEATTDAATDSNGEAALPAYEYPGPELFYYVLYQYLIDEFGADYSKEDVIIPCPEIVAIDDSDKEDIKVYGSYWIFNYDLEGDILMNRSGGAYPGCIHMKLDETGYTPLSIEVVGDGSDFTPTAQKIFGDYYDEFIKVNSDEETREKTRAQIIANYVAANNLSITAYQDYGWDPVPLPEENIDTFYSDLP